MSTAFAHLQKLLGVYIDPVPNCITLRCCPTQQKDGSIRTGTTFVGANRKTDTHLICNMALLQLLRDEPGDAENPG